MDLIQSGLTYSACRWNNKDGIKMFKETGD